MFTKGDDHENGDGFWDHFKTTYFIDPHVTTTGILQAAAERLAATADAAVPADITSGVPSGAAAAVYGDFRRASYAPGTHVTTWRAQASRPEGELIRDIHVAAAGQPSSSSSSSTKPGDLLSTLGKAGGNTIARRGRGRGGKPAPAGSSRPAAAKASPPDPSQEGDHRDFNLFLLGALELLDPVFYAAEGSLASAQELGSGSTPSGGSAPSSSSSSSSSSALHPVTVTLCYLEASDEMNLNAEVRHATRGATQRWAPDGAFRLTRRSPVLMQLFLACTPAAAVIEPARDAPSVCKFWLQLRAGLRLRDVLARAIAERTGPALDPSHSMVMRPDGRREPRPLANREASQDEIDAALQAGLDALMDTQLHGSQLWGSGGDTSAAAATPAAYSSSFWLPLPSTGHLQLAPDVNAGSSGHSLALSEEVLSFTLSDVRGADPPTLPEAGHLLAAGGVGHAIGSLAVSAANTTGYAPGDTDAGLIAAGLTADVRPAAMPPRDGLALCSTAGTARVQASSVPSDDDDQDGCGGRGRSIIRAHGSNGFLSYRRDSVSSCGSAGSEGGTLERAGLLDSFASAGFEPGSRVRSNSSLSGSKRSREPSADGERSCPPPGPGSPSASRTGHHQQQTSSLMPGLGRVGSAGSSLDRVGSPGSARGSCPPSARPATPGDAPASAAADLTASSRLSLHGIQPSTPRGSGTHTGAATTPGSACDGSGGNGIAFSAAPGGFESHRPNLGRTGARTEVREHSSSSCSSGFGGDHECGAAEAPRLRGSAVTAVADHGESPALPAGAAGFSSGMDVDAEV